MEKVPMCGNVNIKSLTVNDTNYHEFKKVIEIICRHRSTLPLASVNDANLIDILNGWEASNKWRAKRELKESLRDCLLQLKDFPPHILEAINRELEDNHLPNVKALLALLRHTVVKVLVKGKISNLDEYYILKEIVMTRSDKISEEQRTLFARYMDTFEIQTRRSCN